MPAEIDRGVLKADSGLKNSMANVVGLLIPLVIFLGVTPYLLSGLGADGFGLVTLFLAALAFAGALDFGLADSGIRILGEAFHQGGRVALRDAFRECWSAYFFIACSAFSIIAIASLAWYWWFGEIILRSIDATWFVVCFAVALFANYFIAVNQLVPRALESYFGMMLIQVGTGAVLWIGALLLVLIGATVDWIVAWVALTYSCASFVNAIWIRSLLGGSFCWPVFRFKWLSRAKSYALFVIFSQLAGAITYHGDKLVITLLLGAAATGYYGIASSVSSKLLTLISVMSGVVFARAVRLSVIDDMAGLRAIYIQASRYVLLTAWPMFVVALIFSGIFLRLWLGNEAAKTVAWPLRILLLAYFIHGMSVVAGNVLKGMGDSRTSAKFFLICAFVDIVACVVLIPTLGLLGAALAAMLGAMQVLLFLVVVHRKLALRDEELVNFWGRLAVIGTLQCVFGKLLLGYAVGWWSLLCVSSVVWGLFYLVWFGLPFANPTERKLLKRVWYGTTTWFLRLR